MSMQLASSAGMHLSEKPLVFELQTGCTFLPFHNEVWQHDSLEITLHLKISEKLSNDSVKVFAKRDGLNLSEPNLLAVWITADIVCNLQRERRMKIWYIVRPLQTSGSPLKCIKTDFNFPLIYDA